MLSILWPTLASLTALACHARSLQFGSDWSAQSNKRVELTLGVMSRCPDAIFAEASFDKVIPRVNDKIQLHFTYIGDIDEEEETGARCKHGQQECK